MQYRRPSAAYSSQRISVPLFANPKIELCVETGITRNRGNAWPYAKFEINVQRLSRNFIAREAFHLAMNDFMPGGGYQELCQDGYVLYAEFAADFSGLNVADYDAYSPHMVDGEWIHPSGNLETINLNDGKRTREYAFTIYQKDRQEWEVHRHRRRRVILRAEAKRRFNHTPTYRKIRLAQLPEIRNPFATLGIYERSSLVDVFRAARDRNFLEAAQRVGLQGAFAGTGGGNRARRERKLTSCHVDWWDPERVWAGASDAVETALQL